MGRIHRLPTHLANQIAAGEVVERPASVVKELVENAIDAGATRVAVAIELGGKRLIRVEDDGEGMEPDDARLAIERHATSKIRSADDLAQIATLGFRGEALPSIASVSHFSLKTCVRGALAGTAITVDGGTVTSVRDIGMAPGTVVEVGDLFFNLPARRKFLKADAAESAQVSRVMTQLALCNPGVGMTLTSAGRTVLQCPPAASLRDRLSQLYGDRADLVDVRREGDISIVGFIAALAEQGPTRGPQHLFVNGRIVKDRTVAHAVNDAYSLASIKERSPEVHLFIEMPLDAVDVNVHPTKAEVRFRDQGHVHQVVRRAVADALGQGPAPMLHLDEVAVRPPVASTLPLPSTYAATMPSRWLTPTPSAREVAPTAGLSSQAMVGGADTVAAAAAGIGTASPLIPLGQFRDTFIVAVDDDGILIIDQHVAHERILFERIGERLRAGRLESQRFLDPILIELPAAGREALAAHAADLDRLGFEVEPFGGSAVRVAACPAILKRDGIDGAIRALADDLDGLDRGAGVQAAIQRMAATMACHAAVKANDRLTPEMMRYLLEELRLTAYSTICPHGRPVMLRLTRRDVEKNFQRI
jgi:DNA mismatch repair protein MutL